MSRHRPHQPFPVQATNATTVGPQVARAVTANPKYEEKTLAGILDRGGDRLRIFRQSTMEHDDLSSDIYSWDGKGWQPKGKERVKYVPPEEFQGTRMDIDGVPVRSFDDIAAEQVEALRRLLRPA
jgi:hypothetical protein